MSTTSDGNAFRDLVADLLRTQYPDVHVERRFGGTKVDIVFSKHEFGSKAVYGVECKDYAQPLTKSYIAKEIRTVYDPLLSNGDIERVLIVSQKPLGADAAEFMRTWRGASHQTYEELAESLVGLRQYVEDLSKMRPTDDGQYIEAKIEGEGGTGVEVVDTWVGRESQHGLAIWGSYGQGKSSFARRLAALYAARYLQDSTQRLPILLKLGEVVHETQLEGLFGKEFTARQHAPGYRFQTLDHLNQQGRLLILLDGFDEMKHAMTSSDFQANFREFNRLLKGKAKVILLGRPNALAADERELVFKGTRPIGDSLVSSSIYAPWLERRLAFFEQTDSRTLLRTCLEELVRKYKNFGRHSYESNFIENRVDEVFRKVPHDLLKRPVHVVLMSEASSDPDFSFDGFNEFKLYEYFIRSMVERDTVSKAARRSIPLASRLAFQRNLAWWAWSRPGLAQGNFLRYEIPSQLLAELPDGNSADLEGKKNEYIVSTLTEEKESGTLYFAHRSFQEFLVADRVRLVASASAMHSAYSTFLTPDVTSFLMLAPDPRYIIDLHQSLRASVGPIRVEYLRFFSKFSVLQKQIVETHGLGGLQPSVDGLDPWTISILALASLESTENCLSSEQLDILCARCIFRGTANSAAIAVLALLCRVGYPDQGIALIRMFGAIIGRLLRMGRSEHDATSTLLIEKQNYDFMAAWLTQSVQRQFPMLDGAPTVNFRFSPDTLVQACCRQLTTNEPLLAEQPNLSVNPFDGRSHAIQLTVDYEKVAAFLSNSAKKTHHDFLRSPGRNFKITRVERLKEKRFVARQTLKED